MSDNPAAPLLGEHERERRQEQEQEQADSAWGDSRTATAPSRGSRATSRASRRSKRSDLSDERTPLLSQGDIDAEPGHGQDRSTDDEDDQPKSKKSRIRWPTLICIALLIPTLTVIGLLIALPPAVEEYAREAIVFKPTNLSIQNFTTSGVRARIRGDFFIDGSRVRSKSTRDLGRAGTWIAGAVESKDSTVQVYLPQYDNLLLGSANVPGIKVSVRDGQITPLDFVAEVSPGDVDGIRQIANDWLDGRLGNLQVLAKADVPLKSGIFSLGTQQITQELNLEGSAIPKVPAYEITKVLVHEVEVEGQRAMAADVAIKAYNPHPVTFTVPAMAFDVLVPGCPGVDSHILLANATTQQIHVEPDKFIVARARGVVRELPKLLIDMCPGTDASPLDALLKNYLHGSKATVYVRGSRNPPPGVPGWISDLVKDVEVPVAVPSRELGGLIKNFTMAETHFSLPNPLAEPGTPEASPRVSSIIKVFANLPKEINFPVEVTRIRANADVYYKRRQLGILDLHQWQKANSTRIFPHDDVTSGIAVEAKVVEAPLQITDDDLFTEVIQAMLFGGEKIIFTVKAEVDVETHTALGKFVVKGVPAEGKVPIKQPGGGKGFDLKKFAPKINSLDIVETTKDSITFLTTVNMTNPTNYSATIPFVSVNILVNGTVLGHATATDMSVVPGNNHNLSVVAKLSPVESSGEKGRHVSRELLSQYISGFNTTLQFRTSRDSIPSLPELGQAMSNITLEIPTPRLNGPKKPDGDDDGGDDPSEPSKGKKGSRFIQDATMHLFSSSADFTLLSPLKKSTMYITHINATAFYNHTEEVGFILYDVPFAVPPGSSQTPRLPVEWDVFGVGYEAIRQAIGGTLKLDASAEVSLRLDNWEQDVWFVGGGIGARIRP